MRIRSGQNKRLARSNLRVRRNQIALDIPRGNAKTPHHQSGRRRIVRVAAGFGLRKEIGDKIGIRAQRAALRVFDVPVQPFQHQRLRLRVIHVRAGLKRKIADQSLNQRAHLVRNGQKMRVNEAIVVTFVDQIRVQRLVRIFLRSGKLARKGNIFLHEIFIGNQRIFAKSRNRRRARANIADVARIHSLFQRNQLVRRKNHVPRLAEMPNRDLNGRSLAQSGVQRRQLRFAVKTVAMQPVKQLFTVPKRFGRGGLERVSVVFAAHIAAQIQAFRAIHRDFQHRRARLLRKT